MKAFCLAFAFLLASLPANAEELPQTSNAWRAVEPDLAEPGSYQWTVVDDATGRAQAPAAADERAQKSAAARAALAQIRAETDRVMAEARRNGAKVSRIRYDLRIRCMVEEVEVGPETQAVSAGGMPYIWGAKDEEQPTSGTMELCEVDYSQKVRSRPIEGEAAPAQPELVDFKVAFPVD
ncbi:conserved exported protein of unknown function [Hyphomicrobium sp. 1Nfss2.1]|uniref:hypothetical protein n=1 Tax=Hyphomicrobium sp. 1Nfss2.1 TaxID=3413936 RepID=UPI003C7EB9EA